MAAPQQSGQPDNSTSIIWGVVGIFAIFGGAWYVFQGYIVSIYL